MILGSKISSTIVSLFTSNYVLHWPKFFPDTSLTYAPSFDGRVVAYPSNQEVRDYFSWRQVDSRFLYRAHMLT
jgi:tRNA(His) guanylyltransferase